MSLPNRFIGELANVSEAFAENYFHQTNEFCDSPIEGIFFVGVTMFLMMRNQPAAILFKGELRTQDQNGTGRRWFVEPQCELLGYRADFLIGAYPKTPGKMFIVECDGHDFHERTKEQASRDRKRDREFQAAGYKVFRFTGSEIHHSPFACVTEVVKELLRMEPDLD